MPRYYCDYCDTYLTHDSPSVRKQHNAGYKHKANVRSYYQQFEEQQTQSLIDQRVKEHLGQTAAFQQQVGATFQQHLAASLSGQRPRLPVMLPPTLPIPGSTQMPNSQPMVPPLRPPVLPRPTAGPPAYGVSMGPSPTLRPPGATGPTPGVSQPGGLPRPPPLAPPVATGVRPSTSTSSPMANGGMPLPSLSSASGMYQNQQPNSVPTSGGAYGTYNYAANPTSYSQQGTSAGVPNYAAQQAPRVSTISASSAITTPSTPPAGNSDGYMYSQGPTTASRGN